MPLIFSKVTYKKLNPRQQENFNFQKVSAVLADYGFATIRLSDDWQGADFIAQHIDGETWLKVQLKGRLVFNKKYQGKSLHIAFFDGKYWCIYPHDDLLELFLSRTKIGSTRSWKVKGEYSYTKLSQNSKHLLAPYMITGDVKPVESQAD